MCPNIGIIVKRCYYKSSSNTSTRKRILGISELEYYAEHLSDLESEADGFSSDDSIRDKSYEPHEDQDSDESVDATRESELLDDVSDDYNANQNLNCRDASDDSSEEWTDTEQEALDIPFRENPSINTNLDPDATPYQYFELLFNKEMLKRVMDETNRRAQQIYQNARTTTRRKKPKQWTDVTEDEVKKFIVLCCLAGTVKFPRLYNRWVVLSSYFRQTYVKKSIYGNITLPPCGKP